jgi:hypothetical protein
MNPRLEKLLNYMAAVDPNMVNKLAYKYGYIPPQSEESRRGFLYKALGENGNKFLKSIAKYHPDRELILNADGANIEPNVIDLREPKSDPIPAPLNAKSETLRIIVIAIVILVIYHILSKHK